jgi:hypothetical protein
MYLKYDGNFGIGTTNPLTSLSITPSALGAKITLWDYGSTINHYGFGVSAPVGGSQLNYHVDGTSSSHVFYYGGKNGEGTELMRINGTGITASKAITANASSTIKNTSGSVYTLKLLPYTSSNTSFIFANDMQSGWYNPNTQAGDAGIIFNQGDAPQAGEALIIAPHTTASSATSFPLPTMATRPAVRFCPTKLPPVILPVAVTRPAVFKLPPDTLAADIILPLALSRPVMYSPVVENTATFDVPPTVILALPEAVGMLTSVVPLAILATLIPVSCDPLPMK